MKTPTWILVSLLASSLASAQSVSPARSIAGGGLFAGTITPSPGSTFGAPLRAPATPERKRPYVTYVTGEFPGADVVFKVEFDPRIAFSALVTVAAVETRAFALDGIDFIPGPMSHVVVGAPIGVISRYDVSTGFTLSDAIPDTDMIAAPPATPGTRPSTVLSTPTHFYYIENQFGFGPTSVHRIIRKPWAGGPETVVYNGAVHGLVNFEGLEIVAGRLYFFAKSPIGPPDTRALISVGLAGGVWDGMPFALEIPGLTEAPGPAIDGSDELDFDPWSGLIFGTNMINGEMIAFDPIGSFEVSSPGAAHFVDGAQVAASAGNLSLLGGDVDGIRSVGDGWLVFTGKAGVIAAVRIASVLGDGADDGDIRPLFVMPGMVSFDDLTPVRRN